MNTKNIQPKTIFTQYGEKDATILALKEFYGYHFDDGGGKVNYELLGMESPGVQYQENDDVTILPEVAVCYFTGTIDIPSSVVTQWGNDDNIIWDYIMNKLQINVS